MIKTRNIRVAEINECFLENICRKFLLDNCREIVKKADEISKLPLYIDDTPALSIASIRTRVRRMVRQKNLGILFLDYLQQENHAIYNF